MWVYVIFFRVLPPKGLSSFSLKKKKKREEKTAIFLEKKYHTLLPKERKPYSSMQLPEH